MCLGVALSRQYARLMGGDLTVNSTLGKGSVFRFEFEADLASEGGVAKNRSQESGGKQTLVTALSASGVEEGRASALGAEADGFIRAPFFDKEVFEAPRQSTDVAYDSDSRETSGQPSVFAGTAASKASLEALPAGLTERMYDAIAAARISEFEQLAAEAREYDAGLGDRLLALADQYEYETLLDLLKPGMTNRLGETNVENTDCG
jgi:CheY-like chemotaxis protein